MRKAIDQYLDEVFSEVDQWDREEAIYWFATKWHGGQSSPLYSVLSTSPFNPGPLSRGPESELAEMIVVALAERFCWACRW